MTGPRIENSERGITLNKSLAYTISVGILIGGMWLGSEVVGTKRMVQDLRDAQRDEAAALANSSREFEARLRALEGNREGATAEISFLSRTLEEIKAEQRETNSQIQELAASINRAFGGQQP